MRKGNIDELKGSMTKIMEMLQEMAAKENQPQRTMISQISGFILEPQTLQRVDTLWPEYGLPPKYSSPYENILGLGPSTQHVVQMYVITKKQPISHTQAQTPFEDHRFVYHSDGSQNRDQEKDKQVNEGEIEMQCS